MASLRLGYLCRACLVWIVIYAVYTAYVTWNILLGEEIAKGAMRDADMPDATGVRMYYFFGGWGWGIVVGLCATCWACICLHVAGGDDEEELNTGVCVLNAFWLLATYILLVDVGYHKPMNDLRKKEILEHALDTGEGTAFIGCTTADSTGAITLPENYNFFKMTEPGWYPAPLNNQSWAKFYTKPHPDAKEWQYMIVPLVYNESSRNTGSGGAPSGNGIDSKRCFFDPPLYTLCVKRTTLVLKTTSADCGWWPGAVDSNVALRRTMGKSTWYTEDEQKFFPNPPCNKSRSACKEFNTAIRASYVDFDSPTEGQVRAEVDRIQGELYALHGHYIKVWLILGAVMFTLWHGCYLLPTAIDRSDAANAPGFEAPAPTESVVRGHPCETYAPNPVVTRTPPAPQRADSLLTRTPQEAPLLANSHSDLNASRFSGLNASASQYGPPQPQPNRNTYTPPLHSLAPMPNGTMHLDPVAPSVNIQTNRTISGETLSNETIDRCTITNSYLVNCTITSVTFHGTCTLVNCITHSFDARDGTLIVERGQLFDGTVRPSANLVNQGGCHVQLQGHTL